MPTYSTVYLDTPEAQISITPSEKPVFDQDTSKHIDRVWELLNQKREGLFNSILLRVTGTTRPNQDITNFLVTADTTYKDIVGLRYKDGESTSGLDETINIQVISKYSIVYTIDGYIFLIDRDCGDWKAALEFPGGFIQEKFNINDASEFAYMRTANDLGIDRSKLSKARFHGYIDAKDIFEKVLIYSVCCDVTFDELKQIAPVSIYQIPDMYTVAEHKKWFDKDILKIMQKTLESFLSVIRKTISESHRNDTSNQ